MFDLDHHGVEPGSGSVVVQGKSLQLRVRVEPFDGPVRGVGVEAEVHFNSLPPLGVSEQRLNTSLLDPSVYA